MLVKKILLFISFFMCSSFAYADIDFYERFHWFPAQSVEVHVMDEPKFHSAQKEIIKSWSLPQCEDNKSRMAFIVSIKGKGFNLLSLLCPESLVFSRFKVFFEKLENGELPEGSYVGILKMTSVLVHPNSLQEWTMGYLPPADVEKARHVIELFRVMSELKMEVKLLSSPRGEKLQIIQEFYSDRQPNPFGYK